MSDSSEVEYSNKEQEEKEEEDEENSNQEESDEEDELQNDIFNKDGQAMEKLLNNKFGVQDFYSGQEQRALYEMELSRKRQEILDAKMKVEKDRFHNLANRNVMSKTDFSKDLYASATKEEKENHKRKLEQFIPKCKKSKVHEDWKDDDLSKDKPIIVKQQSSQKCGLASCSNMAPKLNQLYCSSKCRFKSANKKKSEKLKSISESNLNNNNHYYNYKK